MDDFDDGQADRLTAPSADHNVDHHNAKPKGDNDRATINTCKTSSFDSNENRKDCRELQCNNNNTTIKLSVPSLVIVKRIAPILGQLVANGNKPKSDMTGDYNGSHVAKTVSNSAMDRIRTSMESCDVGPYSAGTDKAGSMDRTGNGTSMDQCSVDLQSAGLDSMEPVKPINPLQTRMTDTLAPAGFRAMDMMGLEDLDQNMEQYPQLDQAEEKSTWQNITVNMRPTSSEDRRK